MSAKPRRETYSRTVVIVPSGKVRFTSMTKDEEDHLDKVQQLGCIVCWIEQVYSPAEIHHILDGGRRRGHKYVLPLCFPHHRGGCDGTTINFISRHPYKARFEERYGTEERLLERVSTRLHERFGN